MPVPIEISKPVKDHSQRTSQSFPYRTSRGELYWNKLLGHLRHHKITYFPEKMQSIIKKMVTYFKVQMPFWHCYSLQDYRMVCSYLLDSLVLDFIH